MKLPFFVSRSLYDAALKDSADWEESALSWKEEYQRERERCDEARDLLYRTITRPVVAQETPVEQPLTVDQADELAAARENAAG